MSTGTPFAHDDQVFDAHPAAVREVDARLHGDDVADDDACARVGAEHRPLVHLEPDPVARPWRIAARRDSSMRPRAIASSSDASAPARTSASALSWAERQSAPPAGGRPEALRMKVRVQSEQYPPTWAPASTITVSPAPILRRPG